MDPLNQVIILARELRRDLRAWIDHQNNSQNKGGIQVQQTPERPIEVQVTSELRIPDASLKNYEEGQSKNYRLQWVTLIVTTLSLIVLMVYAGYTIRIYRANEKAAQAAHDTLGEVQKQTTLMRQQLVGTQSAVVVFNAPSPLIDPYPLVSRQFNISTGLRNEGHIIANNVELHLVVQSLRIATGARFGKQWRCDYAIGVMPPSTVNRPAEYRQCFVDGISKSEFDLLNSMESTIGVEGFYGYDNGFGETKRQQFCLRYQPFVKTKTHGIYGSAQLTDCDIFPVLMQAIKKGISEER